MVEENVIKSIILAVLLTFFLYRYPGLKMSHLIDWGEQIEKPKYRGFEAYQEKKPKGIFRLSDSIIRKCVVVSRMNFESYD